jgi:arsenite methyltransferase
MTRDLLFGDEIRALVTEAYDKLDGPSGAARSLYDDTQRARLAEEVLDWGLGVGNPVAHARLRPGEQVVDLGCGAGVDVQLAAREVGAQGSVVGIDLLDAMVERARRFAAQAGLDNVGFVAGSMESVPLPDGSADVVMSNGSVNLCARKSRVLAEAFRVLRPGGRLVISDLTVREEELPAEVLTHPSAWAG